MNSLLDNSSTSPPDPIGDALADCYSFLLRRMREKSSAAHTAANMPEGNLANLEDATPDIKSEAALMAVDAH